MTASEKIPFWRDTRILNLLGQIFVILVLVGILIFLGNNLIINFQRLRLNFGFEFIFDTRRPAGFNIGNSPIPYQPTDPVIIALLVGLINSLRVMISGIILAAILGIMVGLGRLSSNWLVRQIATVYVEIFRNTPLLLQLFFWYSAVFLKFPKIDNPLILFNSILLSNRGMAIPWPSGKLQTWLSLILLFINAILAFLVWRTRTQRRIQQGESGNRFLVILSGIGITSLLALMIGLDWQKPLLNIELGRIEQGLILSPEFASLLIGLTVYTAAFIAEVVRAGIQSVNQGQWEAAKALGLKPSLVMQLVIFPQALRVMIPPLTSEFLNLAKNSSLASATLYKDIFAVSYTVAEKTGRAVEMMLVVMSTYLIINLIISSGMNTFNHLVQLKER
ncbi:polar amino acid ABC transporter, inner membrane subunit [Gloeothece citriformis PCC 7424]|uniref:Polar amino acid ABC transporter, inner membrane subunit n=1 Tax=Gloeothece citriformis (strain PCC 7424) TaxID=65393 RepID=B7KFX9_GLOC7|nr:ABC transporter permease subunit [Gloeothece citriformis]ACK69172.1 polar amino acid ABC transporter, inner membrane subunit [Gloeothece citriformis PCC 7424]